MRVLVVVVYDLRDVVLSLRDSLLGVLEGLEGDVGGGEGGVREHGLLDPGPAIDAHSPPVSLLADVLLVLEGKVAGLLLLDGDMDELVVGGDVGVELPELLLAGGQLVGEDVDLALRLLPLAVYRLLPLHHLQLIMVLPPLRILYRLLQHLSYLRVAPLLQTDVFEVVGEALHVFRNVEDLSLQEVLLFIGEFAEVGLVLVEELLCGLPLLLYLGDEQLVEAEEVNSTGLALEDDLAPDLVGLLLQGVAEQFGHYLQNPVDLPIELFLEIGLSNLLEPEVIDH